MDYHVTIQCSPSKYSTGGLTGRLGVDENGEWNDFENTGCNEKKKTRTVTMMGVSFY